MSSGERASKGSRDGVRGIKISSCKLSIADCILVRITRWNLGRRALTFKAIAKVKYSYRFIFTIHIERAVITGPRGCSSSGAKSVGISRRTNRSICPFNLRYAVRDGSTL
jgi:hypothetical protein